MATPLAVEVRIVRDHAGPANLVLNKPGGNVANVEHARGEWVARGNSFYHSHLLSNFNLI